MNRNQRDLRRAVVAAVIGALALAACGHGSSGAAATSTTPTTRMVVIGKDSVAPATTQPVGLGPAVTAAQDAACDTDFKTLRTAESLYQTVYGSFTTIADLVAKGYLQSASAYYVGTKLGTPPGGYTLVAAPSGPCASLPVGGSQ